MYKVYAGKDEFSFMLQRPRLISTTILGDLSLATMIKHCEDIFVAAARKEFEYILT